MPIRRVVPFPYQYQRYCLRFNAALEPTAIILFDIDQWAYVVLTDNQPKLQSKSKLSQWRENNHDRQHVIYSQIFRDSGRRNRWM